MQAHGILSPFRRTAENIDHLIQVEISAVVNFTVFRGVLQQLRINQRSGIDDDFRFLKQTHAPDGDQIRRAASRAHKMYDCC